MKKACFIAIVVPTCLLAGSAVQAQDLSVSPGLVMTTGADFAMQSIHQDVLKRSVGLGPRRAAARGTPARQGLAAAQLAAPPAGALGLQGGPAPWAEVRPMAYQPSAALERETIASFLGRLERKDAAAARSVGPLLNRHGYSGEFRRFIRGTPLTERDTADAVAMFVVMGWLIANSDMRDVPKDHWLAVRNQFRAGLGDQPKFASAAARAALGEEMKLLSAILYGGWDGERKAGRSAAYADGVARMFRGMGLDLRNLTLDEQGLLARS